VPLTHDGAIALLKLLQGSDGELEFGRAQRRKHRFADRVVKQVAAHVHAILGR
jgi:hypothetical protein